MTTNNSWEIPLLPITSNGYETTAITIPPETPPKSMRELAECKRIILQISVFLSGDEYERFEKVYNDFYQRKIIRLKKIEFGIRIIYPELNLKSRLYARTVCEYNKLTPEDRLLRAKEIAESHPTKQALDDFQKLEDECRKIFDKEDAAPLPMKQLLAITGKTTPNGGLYEAQADLYATLMLQHLRKIIPSKSLVEFTSSETEASDHLHKNLNTFLFYLNELQTLADYQQSTEEKRKSLPIDKRECTQIHPQLITDIVQNLAACLAIITQIKKNVSGLQDRHLAQLKAVSNILMAKGFPALALEILNPNALFEDPQHLTLSSLTHIFALWSEISLAYLKKYPDTENIEPMLARFNEIGKQAVTYPFPTNVSLINDTTKHLDKIIKEIHTFTEHKKLLSGVEAKILTDRLRKLNSLQTLQMFDLRYLSVSTKIKIYLAYNLIFLVLFAMTVYAAISSVASWNLNPGAAVALALVGLVFIIGGCIFLPVRQFRLLFNRIDREKTQLATTWKQ